MTPIKSALVSSAIALAASMASPIHADTASENAASTLLDAVQSARGLGNATIKDPVAGGGDNNGGGSGGVDTAAAQAFFTSEVHDLIYPTCYSSCHATGGTAPALGARLIFEGPGANQVDLNYDVLSTYITEIADGEYLLGKISNSDPLSPHTGGAVYKVGSAEYEAFKTFTEFF